MRPETASDAARSEGANVLIVGKDRALTWRSAGVAV